jgi:sugar phosphate isomerase/epimerase
MDLAPSLAAHLTYCLNVHPGETLADVTAAIREHAAAIRAQVAPGRRFGLGLRLADRASRELEDPARARSLQESLRELDGYVFTINGFPFGTFHGTAVKTDVYRPDWREPARRDYTCRLAHALAALLPEGISGSISTVPGAYKPFLRAAPQQRGGAGSAADLAAMVNHLAETAAVLDAIRRETGREIHLGLEPEPDCFLETTGETIAFFHEQLLPQGSRRLAEVAGVTPAAAEALLRRHVGVCFDACHLALQYEDLSASLRRLAAAGVRISKVQLSAALRTRWNAAAAAALRPFCDAVYLHQVKARDAAGRVISHGDLEDALRRAAAGAGAAAGEAHAPVPGEEWRVHCHVPLFVAALSETGDVDGVAPDTARAVAAAAPGGETLASTASELDAAFFRTVRELRVEHLEIETYTFLVLPEPLRQLGVDRSIAEEYRWVLARIAGAAAELREG